MKDDLKQYYPNLILQKVVTNEKYQQQMLLELKNGKNGFCLFTYLPNLKDYVAYAMFEIFEKRPSKLFLNYLATTQSVAGKGIGYENIKFLIEHAKEKQCQTIEFRYCPKNQNAVELYKKFPFELIKDDYDQQMIMFVNQNELGQ